MPRAGHHADVVVSEDIVHVETAMGLIGIRIRIAMKEKLIPEFEIKGKSKEQLEKESKQKQEDDLAAKAKTESELIELEEEKIKKIDSMEEDEELLK